MAVLLTLGIISALLVLGGLIGRHFYPTEYARYIPVHVTSTEILTHNHTSYITNYQKVRVTVTETVTEHGKPHPDPTVTVIQTVIPSPAPA